MTRKPPPPPSKRILKACPGLTPAFDSQIETYLTTTGASGGGSLSYGAISDERFQRNFSELTKEEQEIVRDLEPTYRAWRNETVGSVLAVFACGENPCVGRFEVKVEDLFSKMPCKACFAVYGSKKFQKALRQKREQNPKNSKYIPKRYENQTQARIFARHHGLEDLFIAAEVDQIISHHFCDLTSWLTEK